MTSWDINENNDERIQSIYFTLQQFNDQLSSIPSVFL